MSKQEKTKNILADLRKERGLSLADVALGTGLGTNDVCRLEHGRFGFRISKLMVLARFYRVSVDSITHGRVEVKDWDGIRCIDELPEVLPVGDAWVTAVDYYRRINRLSKKDMAAFVGIHPQTLSRFYSVEKYSSLAIRFFVQIADALGVSVDDLLVLHHESELDGMDYLRASRTGDTQNCVTTYRMMKGLKLADLGARLGGYSKQWALVVCAMSNPPAECIRALAEYEHLSLPDFLEIYGSRRTRDVA